MDHLVLIVWALNSLDSARSEDCEISFALMIDQTICSLFGLTLIRTILRMNT